MTSEDIRRLDGPGLTALAFTLGLAPQGSVVNDRPFCEPHTCHTGAPGGTPWLPHLCIDQANAVFRRLRPLGFCMQTFYAPSDPFAGSVQAWRSPGGEAFLAYFGADIEGECVAFLRVACLAVASVGKEAVCVPGT